MEIFVGNLSYATTEEDVRGLLGMFGTVERVNIITDREPGRSRGFCFVRMPDENKAREAIEDLNGIELLGRTLTVNQARPRAPRPDRRGWQATPPAMAHAQTLSQGCGVV